MGLTRVDFCTVSPAGLGGPFILRLPGNVGVRDGCLG